MFYFWLGLSFFLIAIIAFVLGAKFGMNFRLRVRKLEKHERKFGFSKKNEKF